MAIDAVASTMRKAFQGERALVSGVVGVGMLRVAAALASVLATIVLARWLGPEGFGSYALAFSIAALLTFPVLQGLPTLVVREVAAAPAGDRPRVAGHLLAFSNRLVVVVAIVLAGAILAGAWLGVGGLRQLWPLMLAAFALPLVMVCTLVRGSVLRAQGHAVAGQWPDLVLRPLVFLGLATAFWFSAAAGPAVAMGLHVAAAALTLLVAAWMLRGVAPQSPSRFELRAWARALLPLSTIAGMQLFNNQVDLIALGLLATGREVGIYKLASTLALQVSFVLTIVNAVAAPRFAELFRERRIGELRRLNRTSAAFSFAGGLVVAAALALWGRPIIHWTAGAEFGGAYGPLLILVVAHLATLWAGSTNVLLNMIGREKDVLACVAAASLVNLVLNIALIPRFGMLGAAAASATGLVVWRALLAMVLRMRLDATDP